MIIKDSCGSISLIVSAVRDLHNNQFIACRSRGGVD